MLAPSLSVDQRAFLFVCVRSIIIVYINRFHHQSCQDTVVCNNFKKKETDFATVDSDVSHPALGSLRVEDG